MNQMLKELITAAIAGMAKQLAINPRNLRVLAILDDEDHLLARIDATTMRNLLNQPARKRILRFKLGNLAYDINLGSTEGRSDRRVARVRQRGYDRD